MYLLLLLDLGFVLTPAMKPGKAANSLVSRVGGLAGSNNCAANGLDPTQLGVAPWAAALNTSFRLGSHHIFFHFAGGINNFLSVSNDSRKIHYMDTEGIFVAFVDQN